MAVTGEAPGLDLIAPGVDLPLLLLSEYFGEREGRRPLMLEPLVQASIGRRPSHGSTRDSAAKQGVTSVRPWARQRRSTSRNTCPWTASSSPARSPISTGSNISATLSEASCPPTFLLGTCVRRGHEVLFLCATDEHGTPAELAATKAGKPVAEYCAEMWQVQKDLADGFRLSFDKYGRSSSPQNHSSDPAFRRASGRGRVDRRGGRATGLFQRRRSFPAGSLYRGHLPQLRL